MTAAALSYRVEVEPLADADGGGFAAYVPDLPGCMSDGETAVEALQNAYDAIAVWLDAAERQGRPAPEPTRERRYA